MKGSTIAAIATSSGPGGIGIIKLSGCKALPIALSLFRIRSNTPSSSLRELLPGQIIPRRLYHGIIVHPDTSGILDEVLMVFMSAPHSYTCEDVVEIQAHSGIAVLESILNAVLEQGADLAQPGEFTRRAFLNGRIDLTQAEAVMDMVGSRSKQAMDASVSQLFGAMTHQIASLRDELLRIISVVEASIDFPDETDDIEMGDIEARLRANVLTPAMKLIRHHKEFHQIRDGYKIAIVGRPNVGKSSLMNWLVQKQRSIVTDIPGTTRDLVDANIIFTGIPVCFTDTAGVHPPRDAVEELGIARTFEAISASDLILLVTDGSVTDFGQEHRILDIAASIPVLLVINKIDLIADPVNMTLSDRLSALWPVQISVTHELHLNTLTDRIGEYTRKAFSSLGADDVIPNLRQSRLLEKVVSVIRQAIDSISSMTPPEIIGIDIRDAIRYMDEISGSRITDEILDRIFSSFCIGK